MYLEKINGPEDVKKIKIDELPVLAQEIRDAKRPKKIQRYSMMMLICIMIIYLVVLCTEVMSSLGAFFG